MSEMVERVALVLASRAGAEGLAKSRRYIDEARAALERRCASPPAT